MVADNAANSGQLTQVTINNTTKQHECTWVVVDIDSFTDTDICTIQYTCTH